MGSIQTNSSNIQIIIADLTNDKYVEDIIYVLDCYKKDPMGDYPSLTQENKLRLIDKFKTFPNVHVVLAYKNNNVAGGSVCFNTFSTFSTRGVVNIHDICVLKEFRGCGIGRMLMETIIDYSKDLDSSKITLEVRHDNKIAQELYSSLGFKDTIPPMYFWTKDL